MRNYLIVAIFMPLVGSFAAATIRFTQHYHRSNFYYNYSRCNMRNLRFLWPDSRNSCNSPFN